MSSKKSQESSSSDFPSELNGPIAEFHANLTALEDKLEPLLSKNRSSLQEGLELPLDKAKLDLVTTYALNSLTWMWMRTQGENPKESTVKTELDRIKESFKRLKQVQDHAKRVRVDTDAAKRFVKSGLWKPGQKKIGRQDQQQCIDEPQKKRHRK